MGLHLDGHGVDRGDELVSCPFDLAVTPALARRRMDDRLPRDCSDHVAICSYIALHRSLPDDAACQHREYMDALPPPDEMRTPPWFTEDEYALLARTNLHGGSLERKATWRREFDCIDPALKIDWCVGRSNLCADDSPAHVAVVVHHAELASVPVASHRRRSGECDADPVPRRGHAQSSARREGRLGQQWQGARARYGRRARARPRAVQQVRLDRFGHADASATAPSRTRSGFLVRARCFFRLFIASNSLMPERR